MKIAFITEQPLHIHAWSGTNYYIYKALLKKHDAYYIDNLQIPLCIKLLSLPRYILERLIGHRYYWKVSERLLKNYAKQIENRLQQDTDIIVMAGLWGLPLAYLKTNIPIVTYQDATFLGLQGFYKNSLSLKNIYEISNIEKKALERCNKIIYCSDWAAKTAIENYKIDTNKIDINPLGANIECNRTINDIKTFVQNRSTTQCKLLFVGVEWERKNGDLCVDIVKKLNKKGIPTQLDIVGIKQLPLRDYPNYIINHGFISKSTEEGKSKLDNLYSECHFLIVPSKAEAYGLVFCEANSFGVPAISTNMGGIPTIIKDNINGIQFPLTATADDYVSWISEVFTNPTRYIDLCISSFNEFHTRLNWQVTGNRLCKLLEGIIK